MTFEPVMRVHCDDCDATVELTAATRVEAVEHARDRGWTSGAWATHRCPDCAHSGSGRAVNEAYTDAIVDALAAADGPLSVTFIHERMGATPSRVTVYDHLDRLEAAGRIEQVRASPKMYALPDGDDADADDGDDETAVGIAHHSLTEYRHLSAEAFDARLCEHDSIAAAADAFGISTTSLLLLIGHHDLEHRILPESGRVDFDAIPVGGGQR